jgi:hypothetical protein
MSRELDCAGLDLKAVLVAQRADFERQIDPEALGPQIVDTDDHEISSGKGRLL